jgi:hypothetical protein
MFARIEEIAIVVALFTAVLGLFLNLYHDCFVLAIITFTFSLAALASVIGVFLKYYREEQNELTEDYCERTTSKEKN